MHNKELLVKIDKFYKLAGLLKTPPQVLEFITNEVISFIAASVKHDLTMPNWDNKPKQFSYEEQSIIDLCDEILNKYPTRAKYLDAQGNYRFDVNMDVSEFAKKYKLPEDLTFKLRVNARNQPSEYDFAMGNDEKGLWVTDNKGEILGEIVVNTEVYFLLRDNGYIKSPNLSDFKKLLDVNKATIRHELQHAVQTYIKTVKKLKDVGGLPSKHITDNTEFDHEGFSKNKSPAYFPIFNNLVTREHDQPHALRDVEFYTRLSDAVDEVKPLINAFNQVKGVAPELSSLVDSAKTDFIRSYVTYSLGNTIVSKLLRSMESHTNRTVKELSVTIKDLIRGMQENEFFSKLKSSQPAKYQKAVKEFFKEVNF